MAEEAYSCRECSWSGTEPVIKTWVGSAGTEGGGGTFGGSYRVCPECQKGVRTDDEWHRHDNPTLLDKYGLLIITAASIIIGIIAIVFFFG